MADRIVINLSASSCARAPTDPGTGIGKWEKEDVVELLKTGATPEQSKVKGAMRETIEDGLKYLRDDDLEAIADYLFAQPAIVHEVNQKR